MSAIEGVGLAAAAFIAGAINAVAGGGSLVSFPSLLAAGYAAKVANVTNTVALLPGYAGGSLAYLPELRRQRRRVAQLVLPAVVGAIAGSAILLSTSAGAFRAIVPFLILFAAALMLFQERLASLVSAQHTHAAERVPPLLFAAVFLVSVYGAYFGAGLGILTLALLGILLPDDIQHSNALKGMLSLIINAVAVVYFAAFGPVRWGPALLMAIGALAGGYLGVYVARALGPVWLRRAVIIFAVVVAVILLVN